MNIQTVAENLRNTIAGKEQLLAELKGRRVTPEVSIHYLEININELRRILQDLEQCVKKESDDSWITNPDRMGGAYTDEEIHRGSEWR
jgi:DNA-binding winged helix-turn-helix (wHTH) protein